MKYINKTFILMLLSIRLFAQVDFPTIVIAENGIVKASKYAILTKNNHKKATSLLLESENLFDSKGHLISSFYPKGATSSHSQSTDLRQYYFYENDRIVRISKIGFDSTSVNYLYFDEKKIAFKIKTNDKNERFGLELIHHDNDGKELKKFEIDFYNTTESNHYAYLYESTISYSNNIRNMIVIRKLFNISKEQLIQFKTSLDIDSIENELIKIESGNSLDEISFKTSFIYNKRKQLIKEISKDNTIKYFYDDKGLLIKCINTNKNYTFKSKFIYSTTP